MNAKFVTKMFMLYDCQPYSENMAKKWHKLLLQIAKCQFTSDSENDNVIVAQDNLKSQISYLNSVLCFLRSIDAKEVFEKYGKGSENFQQRNDLVKTLLANKHAVGNLEDILKVEGGRKAVKKGAQELLDSNLQTESMVADRISEILLYSRNISVEAILEQIGDKRETETLSKFLQRFEPLIFNKNLEKSIRELFTSFRLAGVESAVVERVLEHFGHFYYDLSQNFTVDDGIIKFVNKAETYEFVYLLIMLHTWHHNPNLENKTNFKWFLDSVRDICKESYPVMLEKDLLEIFNAIGAAEFESPQSRSLKTKKFSFETLPIELYVRTRVCTEQNPNLTQDEFTKAWMFSHQHKLFHYNNNFNVPEGLYDASRLYLSDCIFEDIKNIVFYNSDSPNFVSVFDKVLNIWNEFGREDIIGQIEYFIFQKVSTIFHILLIIGWLEQALWWNGLYRTEYLSMTS